MCSHLLASMVSNEKYIVIKIIVLMEAMHHFFSGCFQDTFFVFSVQQFDYNVSGHEFIYTYPIWVHCTLCIS